MRMRTTRISRRFRTGTHYTSLARANDTVIASRPLSYEAVKNFPDLYGIRLPIYKSSSTIRILFISNLANLV